MPKKSVSLADRVRLFSAHAIDACDGPLMTARAGRSKQSAPVHGALHSHGLSLPVALVGCQFEDLHTHCTTDVAFLDLVTRPAAQGVQEAAPGAA